MWPISVGGVPRQSWFEGNTDPAVRHHFWVQIKRELGAPGYSLKLKYQISEGWGSTGNSSLGAHSPFLAYLLFPGITCQTETHEKSKIQSHFFHFTCWSVVLAKRKEWRLAWQLYIYMDIHTHAHCTKYPSLLIYIVEYHGIFIPWQRSSTKWICNPWKRWVLYTPIQLWNVVNISCEGLEVQCSVQAEIPFEILPPFDQCCPVKGQSCSVIRIMIFSTVVFYLIFLVFLLLRFWN